MLAKLIRKLGLKWVVAAMYDDLYNWLHDRALQLPSRKREELKKTLKISEETLKQFEDAYKKAVLESLGEFLK